MNPTPWSVLALGLAVALSVTVAATFLVERLAKRYPFHPRFWAAVAGLLGWGVITVAANPSTLEDPVLAGLRVALIAILAVQIAKLVAESRRRDVA